MIRITEEMFDDFKALKREGELMPPWYYGRTYRDFYLGDVVYHVIPLNYIICWFRRVQMRWNRFRGRRTWIDLYASERVAIAWKRWQKGTNDEMRRLYEMAGDPKPKQEETEG